MTLEYAAIDHACNVVRREVAQEYPNISFIFILSTPDHKLEALQNKKSEFHRYDPGIAFFQTIKNILQDENKKPDFFLTSFKEKNFLPWMGKTRQLACFFLNIAEFETAEDVRIRTFSTIWKILKLQENIENDQQDTFEQIENTYIQNQSKEFISFSNILGDAFATISMELLGRPNTIKNYARELSQKSLSKVQGFKINHYPFLIALDATNIIFEQADQGFSAIKPLHNAYRLCEEIAETIDETTIKQWWVFAKAVQEMAWADIHRQKILAAAIYTSEDPFMRSIAYIVAECLDIEPSLPSDFSFYNPFTDQEANERHHNRLCDDYFRYLWPKAFKDNDPEHFFRKEVVKMNKNLVKGEMMGWCGQGIIHFSEVFEGLEKQKPDDAQRAQTAYENGLKQVPWATLRKIGRLLIQKRMKGEEITPQILIHICESQEEFNVFLPAFLLNLRKEFVDEFKFIDKEKQSAVQIIDDRLIYVDK